MKQLRIISLSLIFVINLFVLNAFSQNSIGLTIGSYNIRYDNDGDCKNGNGWDQRFPVITSLIDFVDYDVFGAQEVLVNQLV
ncbi:MAG TPA: endonuclease, partial [Sphingobacterium sp.]|nr:endonuclease [Sphingobacterium sp.]